MVDIKNFLAKYQGSKIKYIPNQGNAGDSLIGFATLQVFDELELDYEICKPTEVFEGQIILYGGGGSLIRKYQGSKKFLLNNHKKNDIIVLPHSFHDCDDLLVNLSKRVVLIAREKISYDYIKSRMKNSDNALLSDDMAFHIKNIDKYRNTSCVGECNAFRFDDELSGDNERAGIPEGNKDISIDFQRPMFMKNWNLADDINAQVKKNLSIATDNIFSYLSKFQIVNTNRLHVGIAAAFLGKTVNLYRGSYHKIMGVYEFSIAGKFDNVVFYNNNP
jgi:exopolysaccharide biosynthesis predicted pyruvyltransferase EpsI